MTPEQLLMPRYEVIADYPGSSFKVSDILTWEERSGGSQGDWWTNPEKSDFVYHPEEYPNIFRKLQWWEHRKESEMPEYVFDATGKCFKVLNWSKDAGVMWMQLDHGGKWAVQRGVMEFYTPATESEYQTYINSKK